MVLIPDFFRGEPAQYEWFVDQCEETREAKEAFMGRAMKFEENVETLLKVVGAAKSKWPGVTSWGAFGLCWGGKV